MADLTQYYEFEKPAVGDPEYEDSWGGVLNANFDAIDNILNTKWGSDNTQLPQYSLSSASATGALNIGSSNAFRVSATTTRTLSFTNTPPANVFKTVAVLITGSGTVNWPGSVNWDGDEPPERGSTWTLVVLMFVGSSCYGKLGAKSA